MEKIKFLTLMANLSPKEATAFGKHLRTARSRNLIAIRVYGYYKKQHPYFDNPKKMNLDFVANKLFGKKGESKNPRKKLLDTFHDLHVWLKDYLLLEKLKDKSLESEYLWVTLLKERGMEAAFQKARGRLFNRVLSNSKVDTLGQLKNVAAHYLTCYQPTGNKLDNVKVLCQLIVELEKFYAISKLKTNCEIQNRKNQGEENELRTPDRVYYENIITNNPLAKLYKGCYELLSDGEEEVFFKVESDLKKYASHISPEEVYAVFRYLKNYCTLRERLGDKSAWNKAHQLDRFALQHGIFKRNNDLISSMQFLNIVNAAGIVGELNWGKKFINEYLECIEENEQEKTKVLADAILLFAEKKFEVVLTQLKYFDNKKHWELHIKIRYTALTIMSLYETKGDSDEVFDLLGSFMMYLKRKPKDRSKMLKSALNFIGIFNKILQQRKTKEYLMQEIKTTKHLYFSTWLFEKLDDYIAVK